MTLERLLVLLFYNPETGLFYWRVDRGAAKVGDVAGYRHDDGYVRIGLDGKHYKAHRLAWFYMTGLWPAEDVDHRDLNRSNNRWSNLRSATRAQNHANRKAQKRNRLGLKGVSRTRAGKFTAMINKNKVRTHLGTFATAAEAHAAYAKAATVLHGEFGRAA